MMITSAAKNFSNPAVMKQRFQSAAAKAKDKQEVVEKLETMATGFLSLDQSDYDQDDAVGSVAVTDNKGILAYAQAHPFGGVLSFDYLDDKGPEVKEFSIETGLMGTNYTMDIGGVTQNVYESGNGLLALMSAIEEMKPPAEEGSDEADAPKDSDKPKETDKPEGSDKPKETEKPKESDKKKK